MVLGLGLGLGLSLGLGLGLGIRGNLIPNQKQNLYDKNQFK